MAPISLEASNGCPPSSSSAKAYFSMSRRAFLKRWLDSSEIVAKATTLRDRERRDAERFNRPPIHLGAAYWALHSLSHAFMAELALECGYPLSSVEGAHLLQRPRATRSIWHLDLYFHRGRPGNARRVEQHGGARRRVA